MTTRSARNASTRCSHCPHDACRPLAVDAAVDSPHRQAGSRWDRSIAHMLERSAVDDGHAPSRHRAAALCSAQGCLQTRAPLALPSTAMQPAPSASSMPALTGDTVDAVERVHAASPLLAGGWWLPAPERCASVGASARRYGSQPPSAVVACTPCRQLYTALGAGLRTGAWTGDADTECSVAQSVGGGL